MTDQEIEKLKNLCEKEGFELDFISQSTQGAMDIFRVSKKDEWKGVEFAECVGNNGYSDSWTVGKIYPVEKISNGKIGLYNNLREYCPVRDFDYRSHPDLVCFKPSTEAAYVEQLKAKAKEMFGEIKDGDRFDIVGKTYIYDPNMPHELGYGFIYQNEYDTLHLDHVLLYRKGKWAKKVEEPVRVNVSSISYSREPIEYMGELIPSETIDCTAHFTIEGSSPKIILKDEFRQLLSKCLEDYLNKS